MNKNLKPDEWYCRPCDKYIKKNNIRKHAFTKKHEKNVHKYVSENFKPIHPKPRLKISPIKTGHAGTGKTAIASPIEKEIQEIKFRISRFTKECSLWERKNKRIEKRIAKLDKQNAQLLKN